MSAPTLAGLRRYAVARTFTRAASLQAAIDGLGFVQADPIRAPARAQDLTLRHRVSGYRAGDLERAYRRLDVEEDFFVNYGFLSRRVYDLMHPRKPGAWPAPGKRTSERVLAFVRIRGEVHPRDVDAHFAHGAVTNYWGGSSSATTHALDHLHYRGLLRVAGRDAGIRRYVAREVAPTSLPAAERRARLDALVDVLAGIYAPLPSATLAWLVNRLRLAAPQWRGELPATLVRAKRRLAHVRLDGKDWYWPVAEALDGDVDDTVARLLAPFDPLVWDRRRFEAFWEWPYRFEAYTPAAKRKYGYYALPLLWRDRVIGWANVTAGEGGVRVAIGYARGRAPRDTGFRAALEAEQARLRAFLAREQ